MPAAIKERKPNRKKGVSKAGKARGVTRHAVEIEANGLRRPHVKDFREAAGISQHILARLTGFSLRAIADWESGKQLSEPARQKIVELKRLYEGLTRLIKTEQIPIWLTTPNPAFGDLKPVEVIERGESDRIWRMIFEFEYGIPT